MNNSENIYAEKILILDFGSQYTQLIARRIREIGVYCEIHPYDWPPGNITAFAPAGIILSGGPDTVTELKTARAPDIIFDLGCPILGICYGMQTMAVQLGGKVEISSQREFGYAALELHGHSELFHQIADKTTADGQALLDVWMSHGDRVIQLPPHFELIATTANAPVAAMHEPKRKFYGLQFHPEVTHTAQGKRILQQFALTICGCQGRWNTNNIAQDTIHAIRQKIGSDKVILGLSGGVDSSVVAALLHKAIGKQLICVFVDNGLLRLNEVEQVVSTFKTHFNMDIIKVDAAAEFLGALAGISCPEQKRKIIGNTFINIFDSQAKKIQNVRWLAQGTIYPDVIESAATGSQAKVIKSHHNVAGLPDVMQLNLLEPVRELFKDEVRNLGLNLGLPYEMIARHPFPGPGLGVRILGEIKSEYLDIVRQADAIFIEELHKANLYHTVSQAFAVFLPVKSVGVMGDARKYEYIIALRAVETIDFMTAQWAHLPHDFLGHVSNRIINEISGVSRVTYDISGKPPATIEWE